MPKSQTAQGGYETFSKEIDTELRTLYQQIQPLALPAALNSRQKAKELLQNSVINNPLITPRWLEELENSLFYATGCLVDRRYLRLVRDSVANLKRSSTAHLFPAEAWPFLPLTVLSRDNQAVHLERIEQRLKLFEKTQQIDPFEKQKLELEIGQYRVRNPELFEQLIQRLEIQVESEEDWENETCPHCSSKRTRCTGQFQVRSADEPMTSYYACQDCKGTFTDQLCG